MEVILAASKEAGVLAAAALIAHSVKQKPTAVLGLATGSTPIPVYQELVRLHRHEGLDFSQVTTFNLDEYVGIATNHPASYHSFMQQHLFSQINISPDRTHLPSGAHQGIESAGDRYEELIRRSGGIDLQLLGIGVNGHIGFNEPVSSLSSRTRLKTLTERTRMDNAAAFPNGEQVPVHVITMGIGTILEARQIALLAFGSSKAAAIARTVEGPVSAFTPASALQLHQKTKIFLDEAAAAELQLKEYYREVYAKRPSWQR